MGVVDILQRKRQDLLDFEINISGEQDDDPPRAFNQIHIEYVAKGRGIKEKALTDAIQLSLEKYCSVSGTVKGEGHQRSKPWTIRNRFLPWPSRHTSASARKFWSAPWRRAKW